MFTGIIESVGQVKSLTQIGGDLRLTIQSPTLDFSDVQLGDSIATNGTCLTVIDFGSNWYSADVSGETINCTTIKNWQVGLTVNLEKAMLPTTRFGGHIVSGHVDGVGTIVQLKQDARSIYAEIQAPAELQKYYAHKGSITVDGISLTVNHIRNEHICLNLVPHTADVTNIKNWHVGQQVNLEVDVLARYLERLLLKGSNNDEPNKGITLEFLQQNGFG